MVMELQKLGYSPNKIRTEVLKHIRADKQFAKSVEENTIAYKKEIKQIIAEIVNKAKESGDELVAQSGEMSWVDDMRIWESNGIKLKDTSTLPVLVKAMQNQISDTITNLTQTTGFKTLSGWEGIENLYIKELNKATMKIASGVSSIDTVVADCIHSLGQSGLRTVDYASGRTIQLDNAVRLAVRTGCHQLSGQISAENIKSTEVNLVQVSEHWGARDKGTGIENHKMWQGKIYYIEPIKDYTDESKRIGQDIEDLWEKTGYSLDGQHASNPLGLYGYNCRHRTYPFFEGVSEPIKYEKEPDPKEIDGQTYDYYAMSQRMRQMERRIRNLKREREGLQKYVPEGKVEENRAKIRNLNFKIVEQTDIYNHFCRQCGLRPKNANLRYEYGDLTKTQAYKDFKDMVRNSNK